MARGSSKARRKAPRRWLWRAGALAGLTGLAFLAWFWWDMRAWRPDETVFPEQGAVIASNAAATRFATLKALGAAFAYLELPDESGPPDPGFAARLAAAREAGLKVGVIHVFDPCRPADAQSAFFTRMVPRDSGWLPPAIALTRLADGCAQPVSDAAVESELVTFINQIETHAGKPVILKLGRAFQERHRSAQALERDLWLMRDRAQPDYAGRPWLLWSANASLVSEAAEEPIEWAVVQK
ncbi:glycoside hydrolase family 25 protein [Erythrobacter sp. T5W1-R]|uniref:glycoside hydrolase family 25 protein n=1 Tax=Erythrobacter sp. T5W1-R TaxID=3101752 RepID=UPI002AFFC325|nr:glycoside hydrolase family 25 protein [Erythrobacter sp. T5W1-R]MEA1618400.1 glycoside hydrolase family 25 protein [Erythrobacter sp. T5W1-R]